MREREDELDALGVKVCIVTFEAGLMALAYAEDTDLAWPILVDESRSLYKAYGMERGSWWDVWGPASWLAYAKLLVRGRRFQQSDADVMQLGGNVLIDPSGKILVHHVGSGPADRPSVASLFDVIQR